MNSDRYLNILFPVYNEKLRLEKGITKTISYMDHLMREDYWITIIDNARDARDCKKAVSGVFPGQVSKDTGERSRGGISGRNSG